MRLATFSFLILFTGFAHGVVAADNPREAERSDTAQRPLIERSYLVAPKRIGDFVLEDAYYDEANRSSGARFRYALQGHQETRFDVFVYPAGRMPQAAAIKSGMAGFKAGIEAAQKAGHYRNVRILGEETFPLNADRPASPSATDGSDKEARLLAIIDATKPVGQRLRMQYMQLPGEFEMHSNGYLFYRHMFYSKVRVSAARERIGDDAFLALADRAARELAASIETFNLGGCANATITVDPNASPDAFAETLVRRTAEIQGENCIGKADDAKLAQKSKDARVVTIEFSPDDWKAE